MRLASLPGVDGLERPVSGLVVAHPGGAVLVDAGVGGRKDSLGDWRVVTGAVADALAGLDMTPGDMLVVDTPAFDHCGQNAVFRHAAFYVPRADSTAPGASRRSCSDGSASPAQGRAARPGRRGPPRSLGGRDPRAHRGPPCIVAHSADGAAGLMIGTRPHAAPVRGPGHGSCRRAGGRPGGLAAVVGRISAVSTARVRFCHHTDVVHG